MRVIFSLAVLLLWGLLSALAQTAACSSEFLSPRLQVGERGIVAAGGSGNRLRVDPSTSADQVGIMPPGTEFEITAGPRCDSSTSIVWWQVLTDDGLQGWTAEGLPPDEYFLEPLPTAFPTLTPSATPTPVYHPPLDLPKLAVLSPENLSRLDIVGQIPTTGRAVSLFLSPDMALLFTINVGAYSVNFANVYTFPGLQPVTQGLPLDGTSGSGSRGGKPDVWFSQRMIWVDYGNGEIYTYEPGSFVTNREPQRSINEAAVSPTGLLALGFRYRGERENSAPFLCFFDELDHRLCADQPDEIDALAFLPDGTRLLSGNTSRLTLYDSRTAEVIQTFDYGIARGGTLSVLPGDIALMSSDGFVLSVNLETGEERTYPSSGVVRRIILNRHGTQMMFIVPTTNIPDVLVVDVATKAIQHRDSLFGGEDAAYSPDGTLAFINNAIFETAGWQQLLKLRGDQHIINFSPDGTLLFVRNTTKRVFEIYGVSQP